MRQDVASLPKANRRELMPQIRSDAEESVTTVDHLVRPPKVLGWENLGYLSAAEQNAGFSSRAVPREISTRH